MCLLWLLQWFRKSGLFQANKKTSHVLAHHINTLIIITLSQTRSNYITPAAPAWRSSDTEDNKEASWNKSNTLYSAETTTALSHIRIKMICSSEYWGKVDRKTLCSFSTERAVRKKNNREWAEKFSSFLSQLFEIVEDLHKFLTVCTSELQVMRI